MAYTLLDKMGQPILKDGREIFGQDFGMVFKSVNLDNRTLRIVGSDETKDRFGDIVSINGWVLENYLKNPVFLWAHNYSSVPLGKTIKLIKRRDPKRLEFLIKWPTSKGLHPFADMILELYAERIINASSVGFIPLTWEELPYDDESKNVWNKPRKFTKQELLELSGCPIPANPSALQDALMGKSFGKIPAEEMIKWMNSEYPTPEAKDDILQELDVKPVFIDETEPRIIQVRENLTDDTTVTSTCEDLNIHVHTQDVTSNCEFDEEQENCELTNIPKDEVEKPYPNEHSCRLEDPDKYSKFARSNCHIKKDGKCIDFIFGINEGKSELQAMRFKKSIWDAEAASKVCKAAGGSFEPAAGKEEPIDDKDIEFTNKINSILEKTFCELYSKIDLLENKLKELTELLNSVREKVDSKEQTKVNVPIVDSTLNPTVVEKVLGETFTSKSNVSRNLIKGKVRVETIRKK
jgi:hypothetical protein